MTIYVVTRVPCDDGITQKVFLSMEEATNYIKQYFGELIIDIATDCCFEDAAKWFGNLQIEYTDESREFIEYVHMGIENYQEEIYVEEHEINS